MPKNYRSIINQIDINGIIEEETKNRILDYRVKAPFINFLEENYEILSSFHENGVSFEEILSNVYGGTYSNGKKMKAKFAALVSEEVLSLLNDYDISFDSICEAYSDKYVSNNFQDFITVVHATYDKGSNIDLDEIANDFSAFQRRIEAASKNSPEELSELRDQEENMLQYGISSEDSDVEMVGESDSCC